MRRSTLLILLLAGALSLALFAVKYEVQDLEEELVDLNRAIVADREAMHVLRAEWSHLNNADRLRPLAEHHLGMVPVAPEQLGTLHDLPAGPAAPAAEAESGR